jgi:hypothetical protein
MASIIDAFLVTLGMDTTGLKKGVHEAVEDQVRLREEASKTADHMKHSGGEASEFFTELIGKASELFAIFTGGMELKEFIQHENEAEVSAARFSQVLKVNVEDLEALQGVVKRFGGSKEGFNSTLGSINKNLALAQSGGKLAARAMHRFALFGIGAADLKGKDAISTLGLLSEKLQKMDIGKAVGLGARMGLDQSMVLMYRESAGHIAEMVAHQKELGVATKEETEDALKLEEAQLDWEDSTNSLGRTIKGLLMPVIKGALEIMNKIAKWAHEHPDEIKAAFIGIAAAIGVVAIALVPVVIELLPIELTVLAIAIAVGLLTYGIVRLTQEWKKWAAGGKTELAGFFEIATKIWKALSNTVLTELRTIWDLVTTYLSIIGDEFSLFFALLSGDDKKIEEAWSKLWHDVLDLFILIRNKLYYEWLVLKNALGSIWKAWWQQQKQDAANVLDWLDMRLKKLGPVGKLIAFTSGTDAVVPFLAGKAHQALEPSHRSSGGASGDWGTKKVETHIENININAPNATDAAGIGRAIAPTFRKLALDADAGF